MKTETPIERSRLGEAGLEIVTLARPKGNVLDRRMITALRQVVAETASDRDVRALLIHGAGGNFSFGASVQEHLPDAVGEMLASFHGLFRELAASGLICLAAIEGHCLGGGLELASFCHRVWASPGARLGQPEIELGVFAPIGSILLPRRVGTAVAEDLLLTGRVLPAAEAVEIGLVDEVAASPVEAAIDWCRENLAKKSAAALRIASRAARIDLARSLGDDLAELERMYLGELMSLRDPVEGLNAFLEKRPPKWSNA